MNNQEIQDKLTRLSRAICCNKPKIVDELPEGNSGNGFVVFEDELYYWDGDEWVVVGGGVLPTFKTINGETIDDGPGDIVTTIIINEEDRDSIVSPEDGMEIYCTDCLGSNNEIGAKQHYQLSTTSWRTFVTF